MTKEELHDIRTREQAATPGPWTGDISVYGAGSVVVGVTSYTTDEDKAWFGVYIGQHDRQFDDR
jgi:hypothetical protein